MTSKSDTYDFQKSEGVLSEVTPLTSEGQTNTEITTEVNNKVYEVEEGTGTVKPVPVPHPEGEKNKKTTPIGFDFFLSHKNPPPDPDIIEGVKYYLSSYQKYMDKEHPRLKYHQWEKVIEEIKSVDGFELDLDDLKAMIDKHFQTKYQEGCNYNILHFVSEGVMLRRMYEVAY